MLSDSVCYQHLILPLADTQHNRAPKGNFLNKKFFKSRFDILEFYGNAQHNHPLTKLSAKQFEINVDVDQQHLLTKTLFSQKSFIHSLLDYWIIFVSYDISWS